MPADLSARLRALLDREGLSASDAALLAGMSRQQVHALLSGRTPNPGVETVRRLVEAAGGTLAEVFADAGGPG